MQDNKFLFLLIVPFFLIGWYFSHGVKTQWVRLIDVFVYGPFLIWLSTQSAEWYIILTLLFLGTTTISYNLRNYCEQDQ
jgi:hypothetical protein